MLNKADELEDEGADAALIESYEQNAQILSSSVAPDEEKHQFPSIPPQTRHPWTGQSTVS